MSALESPDAFLDRMSGVINDDQCEAMVAARDADVRATVLREAAAWVAESVGYPVEVAMPDHPMPQALWDALVAHVHADESGKWHGNELSREETDSWLADEAGREVTR